MSKHSKKIIYLITLCVLVGLAVYALFPTGEKILLSIRNKNSNEIPHGKEIIYPFIDKGDVFVADEILHNQYELSRFKPVEIKTITWNEDPYSDIYWRFNYYNLEPVRNLLYAYEKTGNKAYKDKLVAITTSFIDSGMNGQYSWDLHGVAFRTMTLTNIWVKLHNKRELPKELDEKILAALKVHGDYLADPKHFEKDYNHGLDQSAALYVLAINFPNMDGADGWRKLATERINQLLVNIVDGDGVLVENSPYYHFYVLEKLWDLNTYQKENNLTISSDLNEKIDKMISYGTYVLQPDGNVPTIGASLKGEIKLSGIYEEMAATHPELLYVLTKGAQGTKPAHLNMQYPVSGETIMRSGWGNGDAFANQTQLIFDVGNYRTNHSDLDALSFNLYSKGVALMPDAGLYTYDPGDFRSYFHGTRAHNTVVVDGKDQDAGELKDGIHPKVFAGTFKEGEGYVYQSGEHELYNGVSHERAIVLVEDSTVLIFDDLKSSTDHTYEQMFHLFPGATMSADGLTVNAAGATPEQKMQIQQFNTEGLSLNAVIDQKNPLDGICSFQYKVTVPCYSLSYAQKGKNASYVTAISIGSKPAHVIYNNEKGIVTVTTKKATYTINVSETEGIKRSIDVKKNFDVSKIYSGKESADSLNDLTQWHTVIASNNDALENSSTSTVGLQTQDNSLKITTPVDGSNIDLIRKFNLDLSNKNIYFKIKVDKTLNLKSFDIYLSNNNWNKYAAYYAKGSTYDVKRDGEWLQFGVAKSDLRASKLGGWVKNDPTFDWSKIDSIKFTFASKPGRTTNIDIKNFSFFSDQKEPRAIIIFDDGGATIMDALPLMNKYDLKGNVAVITHNVGNHGYLTLDNIKSLQNNFGWSMVNHSSLHKNAVNEYVDKNNLSGLEDDITDGLEYLIKNDINTAPSWYIYPNGSTDGYVKNIAGKYYNFARATNGAPGQFPFAEPLEAPVFPVYSGEARPIDVHNAIHDAIKYKQTISLMFHRFSKGTPAANTEYPIDQFESILKDIKMQGIKVVTLSEFDKENGISETQFTINEAVPPQFTLDIASVPFKDNSSWFQKIVQSIRTRYASL